LADDTQGKENQQATGPGEVDRHEVTTPRVPSDTAGTGSYVAISCSILAVLATLLMIAGLLLYRGLT
jgi:hypothetical protein